MARDPGTLQRIVDSSINIKRDDSIKNITEIIYPTDWLPTKDAALMEMIEGFVKALEKSHDLVRTEISLSKEWSVTGPEELRETPLQDYLKRTGLSVNMDRGSQFTKDMFDEAEAQIKIFREWLGTHVMKLDHSGSNRIMVVDVGLSGPLYRDREPEPGNSPAGGSYNGNWVPTLLGLPQIVVPIGQKPYTSKITDRTEYSPIVAGIISAAGSDSALIDIAKNALSRSGWPTTVKAGRLMFDLGDNERHVAHEAES
ncbi:hypothetical protein VE00_00203 [Pseudogymnoascus sp. WSF 3629]|nr:hypothetical protein VE00_00203 [Pseudogymnoascus sp. WSF 3629]